MTLAIPGTARIFLFQGPCDLRKGFEGLSSLVVQTFNEPITSGAYFAFLNRRRNRMKVLYWDADGLALWYKRLEKGHFAKSTSQQTNIDRRQFFLMMEGVYPKRLQKRFRAQ